MYATGTPTSPRFKDSMYKNGINTIRLKIGTKVFKCILSNNARRFSWNWNKALIASWMDTAKQTTSGITQSSPSKANIRPLEDIEINVRINIVVAIAIVLENLNFKK